MRPPLIMHVNYCEQGQTLAEMCQKAVQWGFDGIEFRRKRTGVEETVEGYLDELAAAVEKSGLQYVMFGGPGPNLMASDAAVREAELKAAIEFYQEAAKRFKLTVCNAMAGSLRNPDRTVPYSDYDRHGSFAATDEHWEWGTAGFKHLGEVAQALGFQLAFETHMVYLHDTPLAAKKLVDLIDSPAVGVNLDYGNAVYFKGMSSLKETIAAMGDRLYYVHLKNSVALGDGKRLATGLGDGDINHREYLRLLKASGYSGPICIEAPRAGDREWYAKQDLAYIKSVLDDLGW